MKYKRYRKGKITFGFGYDPDYPLNSNTHTGIDSKKGYAAQRHFDNPGFIYKVYRPQERDDNWVGVYQLVPADARMKAHYPDADYMEIIMGHFMRVPDFVKPGAFVEEDDLAGYEGNFGTVFSGGQQITPEMQDRGIIKGHHMHETWRPVKKVKELTGKLYLTQPDGTPFRYGGYYLEHLFFDTPEHPRGAINPELFEQFNTINPVLRSFADLLRQLKIL